MGGRDIDRGDDQIAGKKGNEYTIEGNYAKVRLNRRKQEPLYTYIDAEDIQRVLIDFPYTWYPGFDNHTKTYYAKCNIYDKSLFNGVSHLNMNSYIMNPELIQRIQVDHIDHDTLNNRKENLRVSNFKNNGRHRNGANENNKLGFRNVIRDGKWYRVQMQIDGKNTCLAKFAFLEDAVDYSKRMRKKHYGEFCGK